MATANNQLDSLQLDPLRPGSGILGTTKEPTMTQSIISMTAEYESATELVATFLGELNTRRHQERKKAFPDLAKIEQLGLMMDAAKKDRNAMNPDNPEMTRQILKTYKAKLEQFLGGSHAPGF